ncbi:hypothetical protein MX629_11325 [Carnobacterium divergens]|uniref:Uncharacterized protein n=1 Tax=Carnobacterium divergens TaxID=2748 RepID=A0AAW8RF72_CARDV|nr:hypothetical protein [Carnobacterium divergens]MDT1959020.1 hypothetical protein [Carnobacterium divergens]MDT1975129.1 hypothetical protein [Carnobacterium divergens]
MEYTLIVFCLSEAEASLEFDKMKYLLEGLGSIKFQNTNKTISYKGKSIRFVSHKSNIDGICCKEYQFSSGLSRKADARDYMNARDKGNEMRARSRIASISLSADEDSKNINNAMKKIAVSCSSIINRVPDKKDKQNPGSKKCTGVVGNV